MNASMAWHNSAVLLLLSPRKAFRDRMPNHISTWFNQLAEVGVKWKWTLGCLASQASHFLCVQ